MSPNQTPKHNQICLLNSMPQVITNKLFRFHAQHMLYIMVPCKTKHTGHSDLFMMQTIYSIIPGVCELIVVEHIYEVINLSQLTFGIFSCIQ